MINFIRGYIHTVSISQRTIASGDMDLFEIPAIGTIRICRLRISVINKPADEFSHVRISIIRGLSGSSSGLITSVRHLASNDPQYNATFNTSNTTVAPTGTPINLFEDALNPQAPYDMMFAPDESPQANDGETLVVRADTTPWGSSSIWQGSVYIEQVDSH